MYWRGFITSLSPLSVRAQCIVAATTVFGAVHVLFSTSRLALALRLHRFARLTISCRLRMVGSYCFAAAPQAFIARKRDGMMRNLLANMITAANAGWPPQFRIRGPRHRPGEAAFYRWVSRLMTPRS